MNLPAASCGESLFFFPEKLLIYKPVYHTHVGFGDVGKRNLLFIEGRRGLDEGEHFNFNSDTITKALTPKRFLVEGTNVNSKI